MSWDHCKALEPNAFIQDRWWQRQPESCHRKHTAPVSVFPHSVGCSRGEPSQATAVSPQYGGLSNVLLGACHQVPCLRGAIRHWSGDLLPGGLVIEACQRWRLGFDKGCKESDENRYGTVRCRNWYWQHNKGAAALGMVPLGYEKWELSGGWNRAEADGHSWTSELSGISEAHYAGTSNFVTLSKPPAPKLYFFRVSMWHHSAGPPG